MFYIYVSELTTPCLTVCVYNAITDSATLRVLYVSHNDIGDEGMAIISEALRCNKSLTTLELVRCGLSLKGTVCS